jgi:molybdopterin converting factor small subunit
VVSVAKVRVKLPLGVTYPDPQKELDCEGATVAEIIAAAIAAEPRLEPRVYKNGKLFVGIFVNDRNMRALGGLEAPVSDGDVVRVLPPIAGG